WYESIVYAPSGSRVAYAASLELWPDVFAGRQDRGWARHPRSGVHARVQPRRGNRTRRAGQLVRGRPAIRERPGIRLAGSARQQQDAPDDRRAAPGHDVGVGYRALGRSRENQRHAVISPGTDEEDGSFARFFLSELIMPVSVYMGRRR